ILDIAPGAEFPVLPGSYIFYNDPTEREHWEIITGLESHMIPELGSWDDVSDELLEVPDGAIKDLYLSAHGTPLGGIQPVICPGVEDPEALTLATLLARPELISLLRHKLAKGGRLIFLGCQGCSSVNADTKKRNFQAIADLIRHDVVAATGTVSFSVTRD